MSIINAQDVAYHQDRRSRSFVVAKETIGSGVVFDSSRSGFSDASSSARKSHSIASEPSFKTREARGSKSDPSWSDLGSGGGGMRHRQHAQHHHESSNNHRRGRVEETDDDRMVKLEHLVQKRIENFTYMKKIHMGKTHWMNVVLLNQSDILQAYDPAQLARLQEKWTTLGLSVGRLLSLPLNGSMMVRSLAQLLSEFDYHFASATKQSVKFLMAKEGDMYIDTLSSHSPDDGDSVKPALHKCKGVPVYEHLLFSGSDILNPSNPASPSWTVTPGLNYFEVVFSLCAVMSQLYTKLLDFSCASRVIFDALLKIDIEIKHIVLNAYSKSFNRLAVSILRDQLQQLNGGVGAASVEQSCAIPAALFDYDETAPALPRLRR